MTKLPDFPDPNEPPRPLIRLWALSSNSPYIVNGRLATPEDLRECLAAMPYEERFDLWPTSEPPSAQVEIDRLRARAEKAERERDEVRAQVEELTWTRPIARLTEVRDLLEYARMGVGASVEFPYETLHAAVLNVMAERDNAFARAKRAEQEAEKTERALADATGREAAIDRVKAEKAERYLRDIVALCDNVGAASGDAMQRVETILGDLKRAEATVEAWRPVVIAAFELKRYLEGAPHMVPPASKLVEAVDSLPPEQNP